jgi:hypothetical protein
MPISIIVVYATKSIRWVTGKMRADVHGAGGQVEANKFETEGTGQ